VHSTVLSLCAISSPTEPDEHSTLAEGLMTYEMAFSTGSNDQNMESRSRILFNHVGGRAKRKTGSMSTLQKLANLGSKIMGKRGVATIVTHI